MGDIFWVVKISFFLGGCLKFLGSISISIGPAAYVGAWIT